MLNFTGVILAFNTPPNSNLANGGGGLRNQGVVNLTGNSTATIFTENGPNSINNTGTITP